MSVIDQIKEKQLKSFIVRYGEDHPITLSVKDQLKYRRPIESVDNKRYQSVVQSMIASMNVPNAEEVSNPIGWVIADVQKYVNPDDEEFIMGSIYCTKHATRAQRRYLSGMKVDITRRRVVYTTVGEIHYTVVSELKEGEIPYYRQTDMTTKNRPIQGYLKITKDSEITSAYDGLNVVLFQYDGVPIFASRKKLSLINSVFMHKTFPELYLQGGGKSFEFFFDMTKRYSDKAYVLTVVAPELLSATKQPIFNPFIVLTDVCNLVYPDVPIDQIGSKEIDWSQFTTVPVEPSPGLYLKSQFELEDADKFIREGYYPDVATSEKCRWGESVLIRDCDVYVHVMDTSYAYRRKLRGENNNLTTRLLEVIDKMSQRVLETPTMMGFKQDVSKMVELLDIEDEDKKKMIDTFNTYPLTLQQAEQLITAKYRLSLPVALLPELDAGVQFVATINDSIWKLIEDIEDMEEDCGLPLLDRWFKLKKEGKDHKSFFNTELAKLTKLEKLRLHKMLVKA